MATRISMRQLMAAGRRVESGSAELKLRENPLAGINRSYFSKYQGYRLFIKECKNNGSGNMEVGFYNLNKLFNFNVVPKTILVNKNIVKRNRTYTIPVVVQEFVKGVTLDEIMEYNKYNVTLENSEDLSEWVFLDYVFNCNDRHNQNVIIDTKIRPSKLWLIDNGHSLDVNEVWNRRSFFVLRDELSISILKPFHKKTVQKINKVIESINHRNFSSIWKKKFLTLLQKHVTIFTNKNVSGSNYGNLLSLIESIDRLQFLYNSDFKITKGMWVK